MKNKRLFLALPAVALAFSLAACGGAPGGGARPTAEDLSDGILKIAEDEGADTSAIPQDQLDCIAEFIYKSDLSDDDLRAIIENKQTEMGSEEAQKFMTVATEAQTECVSQ